MWKNDFEMFELMKASLFTALIGDVLDRQDKRRQFLPQQCQPLRSNMVVVGRAMTVLIADVFHEPDPLFGFMLDALDSLQPNEVYVAAGGSPRYALWGELMSTAARARGATGAILLGYTRDSRGVLNMDFPVFCYGRYAQDQRARGQVIAYRVPLEIGGVHVEPGDIVFGDMDGVVVIPRQMEDQVIQEAIERSRQEKKAKSALANGTLVKDVFRDFGIL
jgi:regulator of RNase E activity RraA